ncbi:MAG TPA: alanine dehydrogenase, partial [Paenibacillus sp.]|nr:alanine dehydrogenase [Paenibacillus sp.]
TTHDDPIFEVDGIRHFCVPNLPSAVARTASYAFTNATIPYIEQIADKGWERAARENSALRSGLDFALGHLLFETTASFQNRPYMTADRLFERLDAERAT